MLEKLKGQSRMDIPEKLATLATQDARRRQTKQKTLHTMCWTPPYTRHKTKTKNKKSPTQYVLATTKHKQNKQRK